ncbi:hypothetical protein NFI96_034558, partial [Prochilodus magdalenae]
DSKHIGMDEELGVGEGEMHSDAEQSTDTDEEGIEELDKESSILIKEREDATQEESGKLIQHENVMTCSQIYSKKQTVQQSGKISLWQFREMMPPAIVTQVDQEVESSTIKQRLALRLSEKRSQESDQSLSLPSSYSKGSTDSGYFSRSESAEQQVNQPSSSAKSYQEIMFGKCYRPTSKPRQSITVQTCMTDINEPSSSFMIKLTKGMVPGEAASNLHRRKKDLVRSIKIESDSFLEDTYQEIPEMFQCSAELLETPPESGLLLRSNSLPTPSDSNLNAPQGLRSSNSFDERMTNDDVSYRGSVGMRRLMRQAAFEHSVHEGHAESENYTSLVCGMKLHKVEDQNCPEFERSLIAQSHMAESAPRKRRKEAPSGGANKRMLSPASSIELFIEAKQQKRVKEEKMYGQIVEELSAVELGHPDGGNEKFKKESQSTNFQDPSETTEEMDMEDPNIDLHRKAGLALPSSDSQVAMHNVPVPVQTSQGYAVAALPRDITSAGMLSQFPSLHTTTCVSWCYLNSSKPNSTQTSPHFSVYASWFVRCHNPNPSNLSTGIVLALLRSKQKSQNNTYTVAAMYQPGILVTSTLWNQKLEQGTVESRRDDIQYETRVKDVRQKSKCLREDSKDSDASVKQTEPVRVKIFEGGYKSNEDYVYVRGRGRGKYICEECGIRCKKPSMLKKHIRTHTDVRPYVCKSCNFAFKTKGNLTKHMKSKAHMKKCLELGVSPMAMDSTDDAGTSHIPYGFLSSILAVQTTIKHQFSDADDSDGGDEDGDEPDDEEDDEYDGDSTPRTISRSTSPQPCAVNKTLSSSSSTKSLDTGNNPKERLETSSLCNEEDLTLEQASSSFDPCPPYLLSPCWDSPYQRYICPRGDLSPQGLLAPGKDTSPLRAISPRRDLNIRGDLSPIRQLSPARPMSPGTDMSRHRAPSPRGRHRGMLRATSPRRGAYQHRAYLDQGRGMRFEASPLRQPIGMHSEMDQREGILQNLYVSDCLRSNNKASTLPQQDIFSHLPLHSQRQVPTPIPMVPIGGLRMPSVSPSGAAVDRPSQSLPQGGISERANSSQMSVPVPGPGMNIPSSQKKEEVPSHAGLASKDKKQEEGVHICAEAIASLRITSEDLIETAPKS